MPMKNFWSLLEERLKYALHKVARLFEIVLHLGGREPSLTSESLEMVSKQLYRIQAVF